MFQFHQEMSKWDLRRAINTDLKRFLKDGGEIRQYETTFDLLMGSHKKRYSRDAQAVAARKRKGSKYGLFLPKWNTKRVRV